MKEELHMVFAKWHQQAVKKAGVTSEKQLYFRVLVFGLLWFAAFYLYTTWQKIPNPLNKAVADTSILLIGFSMLMSSLCYFWNFLDTKIIYRKHLGLIGFAFGVVHIALSFNALKRLFVIETWQQGAMWPILTGAVAALIFTLMTLISNKFAATQLGGKVWRTILRTGYVAMLLVLAHVILLKGARWVTWWQDGMKTPPSASLLVSIFVIVVVLMRVALWWSLKRKQQRGLS